MEGDDALGEMDRAMFLGISWGMGCSLEPVEPFDALDEDGETVSWISDMLRCEPMELDVRSELVEFVGLWIVRVLASAAFFDFSSGFRICGGSDFSRLN